MAAELWIRTHAPQLEAGTHATFAVVPRGTGTVAGAVSLVIAAAHAHAEPGYWIGEEWGRFEDVAQYAVLSGEYPST